MKGRCLIIWLICQVNRHRCHLGGMGKRLTSRGKAYYLSALRQRKGVHMKREGIEQKTRLTCWSHAGFSLVETIISIALLAFSVAGSFELLRLSDLQAKHTSVDNRITELLREYSDYVLCLDYNR